MKRATLTLPSMRKAPEVISPHLYISHDDIGTVLHVTPSVDNPNYRIEVTLSAYERKMLKDWL
jgi:hypothetical protein